MVQHKGPGSGMMTAVLECDILTKRIFNAYGHEGRGLWGTSSGPLLSTLLLIIRYVIDVSMVNPGHTLASSILPKTAKWCLQPMDPENDTYLQSNHVGITGNASVWKYT